MEKVILNYVDRKKASSSDVKRNKQDVISLCKKRQHELEEMLPKINNIKLYAKMEEERSTIDEKVDKIEEEIS